MSASRQARIARQLDRIMGVFAEHRGGVSRSHLALLAEVPVESLASRMTTLRKQATDNDHIPAVLKIGGEWIYGWANTMNEHYLEVHKRLRSKLARLKVDREMLTQSVAEYPDEESFRRQLRATRHEIETTEESIEETAKVIGQLQKKDRAA